MTRRPKLRLNPASRKVSITNPRPRRQEHVLCSTPGCAKHKRRLRCVVAAVAALSAAGLPTSAVAAQLTRKPVTITIKACPCTAVAVDTSTDTVYAAGDGVAVVNGRTNKVHTTIRVRSLSTPEPTGLSVDPATDMVYLLGYDSPDLWVIDGKTNKVVRKVNLKHITNDIAVDSATDTLYVTTMDFSGDVLVINGATDKVTRKIATGGQTRAVAVDAATDTVYVTHAEVGSSPAPADTVIDGHTGKILTTVTTGENPWSVAVDASTRRVYVVDTATGILYAVASTRDGKTNRVVGTSRSLSADSVDVAVDDSTNRVYVANGDASTTSIVNGRTLKVVGTPVLSGIAAAVAVDARTNKVYVTTAVGLGVISNP
jgi:YVTN family beta-propeller protein